MSISNCVKYSVRSVASVCAFFLSATLPGHFAPAAHAQSIRSFCSAAKERVNSDEKLSASVQAAFGDVDFSSQADECVYPYMTMRYADADVLLTLGNVPGNACHSCNAHLSAYVLRRKYGELKLVGKLIDFADTGTFGNPGNISQIAIGGDDGIAIENGGNYQGFNFVDLDFYAFRDGRIVHLRSNDRLILSADSTGAFDDTKKAISVTGSWTIDPFEKDRINVDYKIRVRGREKIKQTVWYVNGNHIDLNSGSVPPEAMIASGG